MPRGGVGFGRGPASTWAVREVWRAAPRRSRWEAGPVQVLARPQEALRSRSGRLGRCGYLMNANGACLLGHHARLQPRAARRRLGNIRVATLRDNWRNVIASGPPIVTDNKNRRGFDASTVDESGPEGRRLKPVVRLAPRLNQVVADRARFRTCASLPRPCSRSSVRDAAHAKWPGLGSACLSHRFICMGAGHHGVLLFCLASGWCLPAAERKADAIAGSNWLPALALISSRAASHVRALR